MRQILDPSTSTTAIKFLTTLASKLPKLFILIGLGLIPLEKVQSNDSWVQYGKYGKKGVNIILRSQHYRAKWKGEPPIIMPQGVPPRKGEAWRDMEMNIYIYCLNPQLFQHKPKHKKIKIWIPFAPHPKDRKAIYWMDTMDGWWRTIKEIFRGYYFEEEGSISIESANKQSWPVFINRSDILYGSKGENYNAYFNPEYPHTVHFFQAFHAAGQSHGQVTVLLKSPSFTIKSVYKLTPYLMDGLNKQLIVCPPT